MTGVRKQGGGWVLAFHINPLASSEIRSGVEDLLTTEERPFGEKGFFTENILSNPYCTYYGSCTIVPVVKSRGFAEIVMED